MPDNFVSGNDGFVKLGTVDYAFKKWSFPVKGGTKVFFAFGSDFQRTLPGGKGAQITLEGAYDQGNMPLTVGMLYELHLGWSVGVELVVSARLSDPTFSNEIGAGGEPGGQVGVTFDSDGPFTIIFT